jgi:hypothetical protein
MVRENRVHFPQNPFNMDSVCGLGQVNITDEKIEKVTCLDCLSILHLRLLLTHDPKKD